MVSATLKTEKVSCKGEKVMWYFCIVMVDRRLHRPAELMAKLANSLKLRPNELVPIYQEQDDHKITIHIMYWSKQKRELMGSVVLGNDILRIK